ncbi:hypothetical protein L0152_07225 [bacterium]|nr:hypothetical protein [bacterium]
MEGKTCEILYRDNFYLQISPITNKELESLQKKHRTWEFDSKTHQRERSVNRKTFYPALYRKILKGWHGLTERSKAIILYQNLNGATDNSDIPFSLELACEMADTNNKFSETVIGAALNFEDLYAASLELAEELEESEKKI